MRKSYSSINILREYWTGAIENRGFFRSLLSKYRYIEVELPYYSYLRGEIFIDDLRDNFREEIPLIFDLGDLLKLLYDDFLMQVRKGAKPEQVARFLLNGYEKYVAKNRFQSLNPSPTITDLMETDDEEEKAEFEPKFAVLTLRIKETDVYRGEILLADLELFTGKIELFVEHIIAIVYLDFIENVIKEGISLKIQKNIIKRIKKN